MILPILSTLILLIAGASVLVAGILKCTRTEEFEALNAEHSDSPES